MRTCGNAQMGQLNTIVSLDYNDWKVIGGSDVSTNRMNPSALGRHLYPWANWAHDACSNSLGGNTPWDFFWPCAHHDFSYRNLQEISNEMGTGYLLVWGEGNRGWADNRFAQDLTSRCHEWSPVVRPNCIATAESMVLAVQGAGGSTCSLPRQSLPFQY